MSRSAVADPVQTVLSFPRLRPRHSLVKRLLYVVVALGLAAVIAAPIGYWLTRPARIAGEPTRLPWSMPSETPWTTVNAYPQLKFFEPTCVCYATDGSKRGFVLERRGTVQMFLDDPATNSSVTVLDISQSVWRTPYEDDGAYGLVLHPEFGNPNSPHQGEMFVMYTAKVDEQRYFRLSRFRLEGEQVGEEYLLIDQLNEDLWHNGGGLAFGADGFLYVGVGDEGTERDVLRNGQCLTRDLYCGILRIDVDCRGGEFSHPIQKQPESGRTQGYFIPNDNPFIGLPNVLEEFWAHGLRNPFRIAFDPADGRLWAADVGNLRREEVNLIVAGGNYGWSYREGTLPFEESYLAGQKPVDAPGPEIDPIWEYAHLNGNTCVIGGFVYRGSQHTALEGKFIYADNGSGRVWALSAPAEGPVVNEELTALPVSSKTGIASVQPDINGEPLLVVLGESDETDGSIYRLVPAERGTASAFPERLSETGIFTDLASLTPGPSFLPYEVNAPQSMGAAQSRHWLSVPGNGRDPDASVDRMEWKLNGSWTFPAGTTFVQHFELPMEHEEQIHWRRIETRVLVRVQGEGVYGVSYRWDDQGSDAYLVNRPELVEFDVVDPDLSGTSTRQTWQFFDRQTCLSCHNANAGFVLGFNFPQLLAGDSSSDSLELLQRRQYLHAPLPTQELATIEPLVDPSDSKEPTALRARSYLVTECSACHRDGGARANFYADWERTADLNTLSVPPLQADFGIQGAKIVSPGQPHRSVLYYRMAKLGQGRMPFLGAHDLNRESLSLIHDWIVELRDSSTPEADSLASSQGSQGHEVAVNSDSAWYLDTAMAFSNWQRVLDQTLPAEQTDLMIREAIDHGSPAVKDLFEWFLAADERSQRLGLQFDPSQVLSLQGDAVRGAALFNDAQSTSCSNCHRKSSATQSLGPDLAGIGQRYDRSMLLHEIMHPSANVAPPYRMVTALLLDGGVVQGLIQSETEQEIVLVDASGKTTSVLRDDIDSLEPSSVSLMPENLLQGLTAQQAADLLEYLGTLQGEDSSPTNAL